MSLILQLINIEVLKIDSCIILNDYRVDLYKGNKGDISVIINKKA